MLKKNHITFSVYLIWSLLLCFFYYFICNRKLISIKTLFFLVLFKTTLCVLVYVLIFNTALSLALCVVGLSRMHVCKRTITSGFMVELFLLSVHGLLNIKCTLNSNSLARLSTEILCGGAMYKEYFATERLDCYRVFFFRAHEHIINVCNVTTCCSTSRIIINIINNISN